MAERAPGSPRLILNQVKGSLDRALLNPNARDNCLEPYFKLRQRCAELGYEFIGVTDQHIEDCRWLIFWDAWSVTPKGLLPRALHQLRTRKSGTSPRNLLKEAKRAGIGDRLALVIFEPPPVCPANYDPAVHDQFAVIFTWDPTLVDNKKYFQFYGPNPTEFSPVTRVPYANRKLLVDISSYKFLSHERELNTERRALIRYFQVRYPEEFDLYGEGWNPTLLQYLYRRLVGHKNEREFFPAYRGRAGQKSDVYPHYKFGICYENTRDQPGYISLKIFDCLRCGVVPIYWGAPDITDFVDKEAFIDRREFRSNEELGTFLSSVTEERHNQYVRAAHAYLSTPKFHQFLSENFVNTIVSALHLSP